MCMNCVSTAEAVAAQLAFACYVVKDPVHRAAADLGLVDPPDPVGRDVRTAAFLTALELDPDAVLGPDRMRLVRAREAGVLPQPTCVGSVSRRRLVASALPIGSHSLLTTQ